MTAMTLLTAYSMQNPMHDKSSLDRQLVDAGLRLVDRMVDETKHEDLRSFRETCAELHQRAQQKRRGQVNMMDNGPDFSNLLDTHWGSEQSTSHGGFYSK